MWPLTDINRSSRSSFSLRNRAVELAALAGRKRCADGAESAFDDVSSSQSGLDREVAAHHQRLGCADRGECSNVLAQLAQVDRARIDEAWWGLREARGGFSRHSLAPR